jgi:hypothetical protein
MHDSIAISLEDGAERVLELVALATFRLRRERGLRRQRLPFDLLGSLTGGRHGAYGSRDYRQAGSAAGTYYL